MLKKNEKWNWSAHSTWVKWKNRQNESMEIKGLTRISYLDLDHAVLTNHLGSSVSEIRQPNRNARGKPHSVLFTCPGIFRRHPCAFAETPSEQHQEDQIAAEPPRRCLGPPAEGAERIYWQLDLIHAQVARGWFLWEVLPFWSLVSRSTGPTAAQPFPVSSPHSLMLQRGLWQPCHA